MPTITSLKPIKRQKAWYELRLDDGVTFAVNDELILKYLLKAGNALSDDEINIIRKQAEYMFLKKKALDILARRRITEKDMRKKLQAVKSCARHADKVISDLKERGYIDDYNFAVNLIHTVQAGSPRSIRYISQKLYLKGVPRETANKAIDDELSDYDEHDAAKKLAEKKYKVVTSLPELKAKKRIADYLRSRGFNWDIINDVLSELFANMN